MNPANETEWTLSVPFVSDTPFRLMGNQTGMLYVILFQNMVVSSAVASDIYFSIFVAGDPLQFHEYVQLPALPASALVDPGQAWAFESFGGATTAQSSSGTKTFLSDSGVTLATPLANVSSLAPAALLNGQPVAAGPLTTDNTVYNAALMRTITGSPIGQASSSRTVAFCQANITSGSTMSSCAFLKVLIWSDYSVAIMPGSISSLTIVEAVVVPTYNVVFPSSFTRSDNDVIDRINHLETLVARLTAALQQRK